MARQTLAEIDSTTTGQFKSKEQADEATKILNTKIYDLLYLMFAHDKFSLLIILHGIDTSGKDGAVRHIFSTANPQGIRVYSFKQPTPEEQRHDFLWRCHLHTPESGRAVIFNRSYYEEVTTVRVHPELLESQRIPSRLLGRKDFFEQRYESINDFEKLLTNKGTVVLKLFLHISKDEQKRRFKDRLRDPKRNWKFSEADITERKFWSNHMKVFNKMLKHTSTDHAPWHVIPADHKWYRDYLISKAMFDSLSELKMSFPKNIRKVSTIK